MNPVQNQVAHRWQLNAGVSVKTRPTGLNVEGLSDLPPEGMHFSIQNTGAPKTQSAAAAPNAPTDRRLGPCLTLPQPFVQRSLSLAYIVLIAIRTLYMVDGSTHFVSLYRVSHMGEPTVQ
jgi:hypothetical protein